MSGDKVWTPGEDEIVRSSFPDYKAMGKALPHRSYNGFKYRAKVLKLVTERPPFTARELSIIRRLYPVAEKDELLALLPGRSWRSTRTVAVRHGLRRLSSRTKKPE